MRFDAICGGALPEIRIAITHSRGKAARAIRRIEGRAASENYEALAGVDATTSCLRDEKTGDRLYIVWMTPFTGYSAAADAALLAHEAVHVAIDYFRSIGEDDPSEELTAYIVQDITGYLVDRHFRWKKRALRGEQEK